MTPSEIARETLRKLAMAKKHPTPENFMEVYNSIAGTPPSRAFPKQEMERMIGALPRATREQEKFVRSLELGVQKNSWDGVQEVLQDHIGNMGSRSWGSLIRDLVANLDRVHPVSRGRKLESLDAVISKSSPEMLHARIESLFSHWQKGESSNNSNIFDEEDDIGGKQPVIPSCGDGGAVEQSALSTPLSDDFSRLLETLLQSLNKAVPSIPFNINAVKTKLYNQGVDDDLLAQIRGYITSVEFHVENDELVRKALLDVLRLVIENLSLLSSDDAWLIGQLSVISQTVSGDPSLHQVEHAESLLRDVLAKQAAIKQQMDSAHEELRVMIAQFIDRIGDIADRTGSYHVVLENSAQKISQAKAIEEISETLAFVLSETESMDRDMIRNKTEMEEIRNTAEASANEIERLRAELANVSELVRHDPLTGVLNRKGMDEALIKADAVRARTGRSLCVALLDIDNFKKLNDNLGHAAGDAALVHLAKVVRDTIRPQDVLARYGGEEFVVILPETDKIGGCSAMERVQRELTRHFFMHNDSKVLITFSCGVAEIMPSEKTAEALVRADQAMYLAKKSGKNRVCSA